MDTSKKKTDARCKLNKIYRMETVGKSERGETEGKFREKQQ
jgi:predicted lipase